MKTSIHPDLADARTERVACFFETLSRQSLHRVGQVYDNDARFTDPFNAVQGLPAIHAVFLHMFDTLIEPRFVVLDAITQGEQAFLTWDFTFKRQGSQTTICIHGASHLRYASNGLVAVHRDYWDAANELYAKLPLLGSLMRWLRERLRVKLPEH